MEQRCTKLPGRRPKFYGSQAGSAALSMVDVLHLKFYFKNIFFKNPQCFALFVWLGSHPPVKTHIHVFVYLHLTISTFFPELIFLLSVCRRESLDWKKKRVEWEPRVEGVVRWWEEVVHSLWHPTPEQAFSQPALCRPESQSLKIKKMLQYFLFASLLEHF